MKNKTTGVIDPAAVRRRGDILEAARAALKNEFVGLNNIIDGIADTLRSWFLVPEMQKRPLVVNLWGMTGVGKTALVSRLAELLGLSERFFRYTMDSENAGDTLGSQLGELSYYEEGGAFIVALDEFQKCRTLDQNGMELDREASKVVWDFLDSGLLPLWGLSFYKDAGDVFQLHRKIEDCLREGVRVEKGRVVDGVSAFARIMESDLCRKNGPAPDARFVPASYFSKLCANATDLFRSERDIEIALDERDGPETLELVNRIFRRSLSPRTADGSKSLVFVIGNLDEVYSMSGEFNPDLNADEFHRRSRKITLPEVKSALRKRFRNEQIARLGNIHFIYPAFSGETYRAIIRKNLERLCEDFRGFTGTRIDVDPSVEELLYKEGVYPTMGARPVLSTIHRIVGARLGGICAEIGLRDIEVDSVAMSYAGGLIRVDYLRDGEVVLRRESGHVPELENLRAPRMDDRQALIAVHEAGHAVLSFLLLGLVPDIVRSVSAGADTGGFTTVPDDRDFIRKEEVTSRIAVYLGGIAAEELVFGRDNITSGTKSDIEAGTQLAAGALKSFGFGEVPGSYNAADKETNLQIHADEKMNSRVEEIVRESFALARGTLANNTPVLLEIADFLSDNSCIRGEELITVFRRHGAGDDGRVFPYRDRLKTAVAKTAGATFTRTPRIGAESFLLNSGLRKDEGK